MGMTLRAVCALIFHPEDRNYILGVSRKDDLNAFGLPGGKVDPGETEYQSVVREVFEETDFTFTRPGKVFETLCKGEVDYICSTFVGYINFYPPIGFRGQKPNEGVIKWCTRQELLDGPFGVYNKELFALEDTCDGLRIFP